MANQNIRNSLRQFAEIKAELSANPASTPKNLLRIWRVILGEDGRGGIKSELMSSIGGEGIMKDRLLELEEIRKRMKDEGMAIIEPVPSLLALCEEIARENDAMREFIFGTKEEAGLFDVRISKTEVREGILRKIIMASSDIYEFKSSLEELSEKKQELVDSLETVQEEADEAIDEIHKIKDKAEQELMKFEAMKKENARRQQELEDTILELRDKTSKIGKAIDAGDVIEAKTLAEGLEKASSKKAEKPKGWGGD